MSSTSSINCCVQLAPQNKEASRFYLEDSTFDEGKKLECCSKERRHSLSNTQQSALWVVNLKRIRKCRAVINTLNLTRLKRGATGFMLCGGISPTSLTLDLSLWKRSSSPANWFAAARPRGVIHSADAHAAPAISSMWMVLFAFFPGDHLGFLWEPRREKSAKKRTTTS